MRIGIGNDHSAVDMKNEVVAFLQSLGHEVVNFGTDSYASCNYPEFGEKVANAVVAKEVDLGIFVPQEDRLILEKRIAIKHLPKGRPAFFVKITGQRNTEAVHFIPVCEDMPLQCLQKLHDARFTVRNGVVGILIKD